MCKLICKDYSMQVSRDESGMDWFAYIYFLLVVIMSDTQKKRIETFREFVLRGSGGMVRMGSTFIFIYFLEF